MMSNNSTQMSQASWQCFAALELELEKSSAVADIHQDNYHFASDHYKSIIVQACTEVERIYALLCGKTLAVTHNISQYIQAITDHCKDFFNAEIHMPMTDQMIKPWEACAQGNDPEFWTTYHHIKHEGRSAKATLEHAIFALAGLFSLLLALE